MGKSQRKFDLTWYNKTNHQIPLLSSKQFGQKSGLYVKFNLDNGPNQYNNKYCTFEINKLVYIKTATSLCIGQNILNSSHYTG